MNLIEVKHQEVFPWVVMYVLLFLAVGLVVIQIQFYSYMSKVQQKIETREIIHQGWRNIGKGTVE